MYVLEITRHGTGRLKEWPDEDHEIALCPMKEAMALTREKAFLLWEQLAAGETEAVRSHFQTSC
jgi:hypothetical protein